MYDYLNQKCISKLYFLREKGRGKENTSKAQICFYKLKDDLINWLV